MYDLLNTGLVFTDSENEKSEPYTTNQVIAKYTNIDVWSVNKTIHKYVLRGLTRIKIEKVPPKNNIGRPLTIYKLNEQQTIFTISLLRNTKNVVDFKYNVSVAFTKVKKFNEQRQLTHEQNKAISKSLGQAIKDNPNTNSPYDYSNFNKLIYKNALDMSTNQLKKVKYIPKHSNISEYLNTHEQNKVKKVKELVKSLLAMNLDYKTIKSMLKDIKTKSTTRK